MAVVENLPAELRERVLRLNAELVVDLLRPDESVWLACDLLVAGVETPTLAELAGESPTQLRVADAVPLVRQTLSRRFVAGALSRGQVWSGCCGRTWRVAAPSSTTRRCPVGSHDPAAAEQVSWTPPRQYPGRLHDSVNEDGS
ncbi:hypothetical protein [Kibdelosporangium phytohabitans]|uniref:hypothetical protein n=1 Tax=Kibdelosporangium phytohabitans TaxID=860235 RepID=UPI0012F743C1|nr:hypothetical protein [Kibdelosporangium phytohabitans]MBE1463680.1 hypothetical protein [Kibdelosporangium phytohabitans]